MRKSLYRLLIDEILAVGDAGFQAKCFNKLRSVKAKGTTIVIVSHSLAQVEQICDRCIWIDSGEIRIQGNPVEVDYAYLEFMGKNAKRTSEVKKKDEPKEKNKSFDIVITEQKKNEKSNDVEKELEITDAELVHRDGKKDSRFKVGEEVTLRVKYRKHSEIEKPLMGLKIYRNDEVNAYGTNTQNERIDLNIGEEGWVECHFEKFNLVAAQYYIDIAFRTQEMLIYDYKTKILAFETYYPIYEEGIAHLDHAWKLKGENE